MEANYPKGSVGYLRLWRKENNIEVDIYKEGTILFIKEKFDAFLTQLSIESVSICKDESFVESFGGNEGRHQIPFVINCFDFIGSENFTNNFIFDKKKVKPGDKVYVAIANDYDPYGDKILGVFTEKPNEEIIAKYVEQNNSLLPEDDEDNRLDGDEYYLSKVFEVIVS